MYCHVSGDIILCDMLYNFLLFNKERIKLKKIDKKERKSE